jgi:hypothetical protein
VTRVPTGSDSTASATSDADSTRTGLPHPRQWSVAALAKSSFRWSVSSVIVPTVDRDVRTGFACSTATAGGRSSIRSACGRGIRSRNCRA